MKGIRSPEDNGLDVQKSVWNTLYIHWTSTLYHVLGLWLNILSLLLLFMSRQISYSVLYMCNYIYYAFIIIVSYRTYVCCLWIIISSWYIYERTDILHLYTVIFFYISVINLRRNAMFMESWICVVYE